MNYKAIYFVTAAIVSLYSNSYAQDQIETIWGVQQINMNGSIQRNISHFLDHPILLRTKEIDISGPLVYLGLMPAFSRYDHSVGVLALLEKAGVSFEEKLAGLFHDVSHTAFSHVGDHLLGKANAEHSYQDTVHLEFLHTMGFEKDIEALGITLDDMDPDKSAYRGLEQSLPNLCADRLQYILHTGVIMSKVTRDDAALIMNDLYFDGQNWYFCEERYAQQFAELSIDFTKNLWGSGWNFFIYEIFTLILKRAMECELISLEDIKFGTDQKIIDILKQSKDSKIVYGLSIMSNVNSYFETTTFGLGFFNVKPKCRAVDPLVMTIDGLKKLSEMNVDFKGCLEAIQNWCSQGYGIQPVNIAPLNF